MKAVPERSILPPLFVKLNRSLQVEESRMSESSQQFPIGLVGKVSVNVTPEMTAKHMGSGAVQVFATPEMVRLMEKAAVAALRDHLAPGQESVGTLVNVRRLASTPLGATVTARAELVGVDGRRLTFNVSASDGVDTIGEGTHERALIDVERFQARAEAKRAAMQKG
jgi:fluoroacetyl-CoA thioesterase